MRKEILVLAFGMVAIPLTTGCSEPEKNIEEELRSKASFHTIQQTVNGEVVDRFYTVHTPLDWDISSPLPLFFAFHGGGGVGDYFVEDFNESIQSNTFIGVYPEGLEGGWNVEFDASGPDDVEFVLSILEELDGTPGMDTTNPVAFGYSNGAAFVHGLPLETNRFVSIGAMASQLLVDNQPQPGDSTVSVLQLHGTLDTVIEYEGSADASEGDFAFLPAEESAAVWAAHNGCNELATETASGPYTRMEWGECTSGARVVHYRLEGVGHDIPWNVEGDTFWTIVDFLIGTRP